MRTDKPERKAAQREAERLQREIDNELAQLARMPNVRVLESLPKGTIHRDIRGVTEQQLRRIFRGRGC